MFNNDKELLIIAGLIALLNSHQIIGFILIILGAIIIIKEIFVKDLTKQVPPKNFLSLLFIEIKHNKQKPIK